MARVQDDAESAAPPWQELVAVAAVAGDLTVAGIARYAKVDHDVAAAALDDAARAGLVAPSSTDDEALLRLVADLPVERVAEVHAAAARHLLAEGPEGLIDAIGHARSAGLPLEELVSMADRGGRMSLALCDSASAREMLALAVDLDTSEDFGKRGRRICDLADAVAGLGDDAGSKRLLLQAAQLGEVAKDGELVARSAVAYSVPSDWNDGDPQAIGLLHRAESMELSAEHRVAVKAARALVEMRIPLVDEQQVQVSWVTRPAVAQPISDEALAESVECSPDVRLLSLLAWRSNHRSPEVLARRREVSTEALDLAQRLRQPRRQVEAAVWLAVDALESADRPLFDETLAVARWVAARDANPSLGWRALTLAAGAAHLDGEVDQAVQLTAQARVLGEQHQTPGWFSAELFLGCETAASTGDLEQMRPYLVDEDNPVMTNALGRAFVGYFYVRHGQPEVGERFVRRAFRQFDEEASYLLLCTRLSAAVAELDAPDLAAELVERMTPWADRVAVDSHAWFCDGPVGVWLALLHRSLGDHDAARAALDAAEPVARAMNDTRSTARAAWLRSLLPDRGASEPSAALTTRERDVLRLIAQGETNPRIAELLSYSVSTIRTDTMSIYRKLEVSGRPEAVARAVELGLVGTAPD
jgi:DNA-binding CsgD family transcriptional regulator